MIRVTALPRPIRAGAALAMVSGVIALAGCDAAAVVSPDLPARNAEAELAPPGSGSSSSAETGSSTGAKYRDGSYTAQGAYTTPETVETISVTLTLADDVVTAVSVTGTPQARETQQYQSKFIGGIAAIVVGKRIDELNVTRVAGSSLTSGGFAKAVEEIKGKATA